MERLGDYPRTRVMTRSEVLAAAEEHDIGAHSYDHDSMQFESDTHFAGDLERCREYFRTVLKRPLEIFAFPNGSHRTSQLELLRASGMQHVMLTQEGLAGSTDISKRVWPRTTMYGRSTAEISLRALGFRSQWRSRDAKKVRVLHVISNLGQGGGAERALAYLLPQLRPHGIECEVAVIGSPYDLAAELEANHCRVHRMELGQYDFLRCIWRIGALARRGKYDVVHGHFAPVPMYVAASAVLSPRLTRIITLHNLAYDSYPATTLKKKLFKSFDGLLARAFIKRHIAVSGAVKDSYERHLRLKDVEVIRNLVVMDNVVPMSRAEIESAFGTDPSLPLVLMLARFVPEKGHKYFVEAVRMLVDEGKRANFMLVGSDGPTFGATMKQIAELNLQDAIRYAPVLPHDTAMRVLAAADVSVFPSTHEGFPISTTEAMLLGTATVSTMAGGLSELVRDGVTALRVEMRDPAGLARAIARLLDDPELRLRLGTQARIHAQRLIGIPAIVPEWVRLYRTLVHEHDDDTRIEDYVAPG